MPRRIGSDTEAGWCGVARSRAKGECSAPASTVPLCAAGRYGGNLPALLAEAHVGQGGAEMFPQIPDSGIAGCSRCRLVSPTSLRSL